MSEELLQGEPAPGEGERTEVSRTIDHPTPQTRDGASQLVPLVNAVTVGLGGVYASTRSIIITVVAAGLVAVLALYLVMSRRRGS